MFTETARLVTESWRVVRSAPLLWVAVFLPYAIPSLPPIRGLRSVDCLLAPMSLFAWLITLPAIPFLVAQAQQRQRPTLQETRRVVTSTLPRFLGLCVIEAIAAAPFILILAYPSDRPDAASFSVVAVLLARHVLIPFLGAVVAIAAAGITLDRLNGFQALADGVLIATNNVLIILPLSILISVIASGLNTGLDMLQAGPEFALRQLSAFAPTVPADNSAWQYAFWRLVSALLALPLSVYSSTLWVLLYNSATAKVAYPWIARNRAARHLPNP